MLSRLKSLTEKKKQESKTINKIRNEIIDDRIKKGSSREMYDAMYKPITETIESGKDALSSQLEVLKSLPEIQEQLALLPRQFVDKIQEAESIKEAQRLYEEPIPVTLPKPLLTPEEIPEERVDKEIAEMREELEARPRAESSEPAARPKEFKVDLNKNIDLSLLDGDKYNTPQEVFDFFHAETNNPDEKMTHEEVNNIIDDVSDDIKHLGNKIGVISRKKKPTAEDKKLKKSLKDKSDNYKKYRDTLNDIIKQGKYMGKGFSRLSKPYKVSPKGQYGNLVIDLHKLYGQNKLIAKDQHTGKEIINTKVDDDLIDLISKRYNKNKTLSINSRQVFKELTEKSGLPINNRSMKFNKIIRGNGYNAYCSCNPEDLVKHLEMICGSIEAGNNNQELKNEGINIIDSLLKQKQLSPENHEKFYENFFS